MLIQLIIIQIITFIIIVIVLRKLLYSETAKEAKRLKVLKDEFSKKEKELLLKIEAAQKDAQNKIAKTEEDARRYREVKEKEARDLKDKIVTKARDLAEEMKKAAINSKEKIREEIELEMKERVPAAAVKIFKETLPPQARELMHDELIEEVIARVNKLEKSILKITPGRGEILSSYPMKKHDKEKIILAISERAGHDISLVETEEKGLVAGVIVKLGSLVIDGSLENKLRQVEERLS